MGRIPPRLLKTLAVVLAVFHLGLVVFSASRRPVSKATIAKYLSFFRVTDSYAYLSGTGYHFGFFAPGVTSQMRARYQCYQQDHEIGRGEIQSHNPENAFRVQNIVEHLWQAQAQPAERRAIAASFAVRAFSRCQSADEVEVLVDAYVLPSMAATRSGATPYWENGYTAKFRRANKQYVVNK